MPADRRNGGKGGTGDLGLGEIGAYGRCAVVPPHAHMFRKTLDAGVSPFRWPCDSVFWEENLARKACEL